MSLLLKRSIALGFGVLVVAAFALWFGHDRGTEISDPAAATASSPTRPPLAATPAVAPKPAAVSALQAACDTARQLPHPGQRSREFGRALHEWMAREPEAVLAYVRQLPPGADYTQGLLLVLEAIGRRDPGRALALAHQLASTREQRAIYSVLFAQLAAHDLKAATQELALVPTGEGRDNALRAVADEWTRIDLKAALAWAQSLAPADRAPTMETVLGAMAHNDPLRAIELAQQSLTGPALERSLTTSLERLTATDARAAAAIVALLPAGETQSLAAFAVARSLAAQNPVEAINWVATLPEGDMQRHALNNVLDVWVIRDLVSAERYVTQLPAGPAQEAAAVHLARLMAGADPQNAIAWAQTLTSRSAQDLALVGVVSVWAQKDPAGATRWAAGASEGSHHDDALCSALSYWVLSDAAAAREFVSGLASDTQVRAAAALAPSLAQVDPRATMTWSQSLAHPAARDAALGGAYARWVSNAPDAAKAWLAAANLPAEIKSRLLNPASQ